MMPDTTYRSSEPELMDDFSLRGTMLRGALDQVAKVNRRLGGNAATFQALRRLLSDWPAGKTVRIADIGCGNGDMLRAVADWGNSGGISMRLTGIDANRDALDYARTLSAKYPDIGFSRLDVLNETLPEADIVLITLTLHHFGNGQIESLLAKLQRATTLAVIVNDLQRSRTAYILFKLYCLAFVRNEMAREDGLVSILRGFRRNELESLSGKTFKQFSIRWKWAFRYQLILRNS
jgi:SAM-dependent methyltransferase